MFILTGCLPLLIQLLHGSDKDSGLLGNTRGSSAARARASAALHNIVHSNPDDKRGRREARTLRLLEQIRAHCDQQRGEAGEDEEEEGGAGKNVTVTGLCVCVYTMRDSHWYVCVGVSTPCVTVTGLCAHQCVMVNALCVSIPMFVTGLCMHFEVTISLAESLVPSGRCWIFLEL